MPSYFFWGEDEFALSQAVQALRDRVLDPDWASFNYDRIPPETPNAILQALTQAMTPPFGAGSRLVWLSDTTVGQQCPETVLAELQRTLPVMPEHSVLLMTATGKPDGRLKSTKFLQQHAEIQEFSPIPPWKTEQLVQRVRQVAEELGVKLTPASVELIAQSVGNDTRHLYSELEKLQIFQGESAQPLTPAVVTTLVTATTQSSLQLAAAIRQGQTAQALALVADLLDRNEPALKIVATLVGQFRTWVWVKVMMESGERDERAIAQAAEISNPKRVYFLQQDVKSLSLKQLQQTLPVLLDLELSLKQGASDRLILQTKVIELCQLCQAFIQN